MAQYAANLWRHPRRRSRNPPSSFTPTALHHSAWGCDPGATQVPSPIRPNPELGCILPRGRVHFKKSFRIQLYPTLCNFIQLSLPYPLRQRRSIIRPGVGTKELPQVRVPEFPQPRSGLHHPERPHRAKTYFHAIARELKSPS